MRKILPAAVILLTTALSVQAAEARAIETACLRSERPAATRALCGCIQRVADQVLTFADQRRAARFFRDPELVQQVRASSNPADSAFWARYREFGNQAEARCAQS